MYSLLFTKMLLWYLKLPEPEFKEGPRADGDYISVGDARFPNEPKAIAKAIKKVMKQDG